MAFGAAGSFGALLDTGDAEKVARELFANGRTVLEWNCGRRMASRSSVKLLLNLCLIAASAVPRGGVITVDISGEDDAMAMRVEAKGTNARLSHSAADFLTNAVPNEPIDGHSIQLYFTTLLARECHATLNVSTSPENVTLTVAAAARIEGRRGCSLFRRRLAGRVTGPSRLITSNADVPPNCYSLTGVSSAISGVASG